MPCSTHTRINRSGFSLSSFLIALFIVVPIVMTAVQSFPVYLEYFAIKRAILRATRECSSCTKEEIKQIYRKQAQIDEIVSVKAEDLQINRAAGKGDKGVVVSTDYSRKQELVSGISLLFEFDISLP